MWNVVGQTLTVASLTAPVSATAPFANSLVTGYGNVKRNLATNQPGDFTDVKNANLEAYVLGMLSGSGAITAATIAMINSSSSTNLVDSDTIRSVQVVNTNTTTNNAAGIAFRTYATNGVATLQSWVKLLAQFTDRTATAVTADLAILTNNAGTISEKMRVTAVWLVGIGTSAPTHTFTLGSTSTGIAIYNTADQTTNFERLVAQRSANTAFISFQWSGTASARTLRLNATSWTWGSNSNFNIKRWSAPFFEVTAGSHATTGNLFQLWNWDSSSHSSGTATYFAIVPTIAHTSTAWYTILDLNPTINTEWSWAKNFILCRKASWTTLFGVDSNGKVNMDATMTAGGTTGNQTINKPAGTVNIAAAWTTVTVTNSLVTANSIVTAVIMTNDATATLKNVVVSAGSFVINLGAAATGETKIWRRVIN